MSSKVREQGEKVRSFILEGVLRKDKDVVAATMRKFDITRQAVNKHIRRLKELGSIAFPAQQERRNIRYARWSEKSFCIPCRPI